MVLTQRREGQSAFGTPKVTGCMVAVDTKAGTASGLLLLQPDGTEKVLWVQNDGKLYIGTFTQFTTLSGGTAVGGQ
jgi:hypothetical protein